MAMIVSGQNSCWGMNVSGHNHEWAQTCLVTNVVEPFSKGFSFIYTDKLTGRPTGNRNLVDIYLF